MEIPPDWTEMKAPFWPVEDIWPPGTFDRDSMRAYKLLEKRGEVEIEKVYFNKTTLVSKVKYLSMEPIDTKRREQLRQAREDARLMGDKWEQVRI